VDESGTTLTEIPDDRPPFSPPPFSPPPVYGPPAALPPEFYAGPSDPLVSPDFAGWWARSFHLLGAAWRPLLLIQLVSAVPSLVLLTWGALLSNDRVVEIGTDVTLSATLEPFLPLIPPALVVILLSLVTSLATHRVLVQTATGRPVAIGAALREGLRRTPALIGWGLLAGLMVGGGLVFCIVPGIYFAAVFAILPVLVLLERGGVIGRAFQLFHANFGAALGRIATTFGVTVALLFVESTFAQVLAPDRLGGTVSAPSIVATQAISAAFTIVSGMISAPMILTAYADMRARREPFSTAYLLPVE
jgi:hypothetical protein